MSEKQAQTAVKEAPKAEVTQQENASSETPQQAEPQRINIPIWRETDPREIKNPVPGRRYHFLSDEDVKKGDLDGWDLDHGPNDPMRAKSANPNSGQLTHGSVTNAGTEVRVGTMVLGWMPEKMALAREKHYVDKGNAPIRDMQDMKQATEAAQEKLREQGVSPDLIKVSGGITMNRRF